MDADEIYKKYIAPPEPEPEQEPKSTKQDEFVDKFTKLFADKEREQFDELLKAKWLDSLSYTQPIATIGSQLAPPFKINNIRVYKDLCRMDPQYAITMDYSIGTWRETVRFPFHIDMLMDKSGRFQIIVTEITNAILHSFKNNHVEKELTEALEKELRQNHVI